MQTIAALCWLAIAGVFVAAMSDDDNLSNYELFSKGVGLCQAMWDEQGGAPTSPLSEDEKKCLTITKVWKVLQQEANAQMRQDVAGDMNAMTKEEFGCMWKIIIRQQFNEEVVGEDCATRKVHENLKKLNNIITTDQTRQQVRTLLDLLRQLKRR